MRKRWGIIPLLAIAPMVSAHSLNDQQPLQYDYLNMEVSSGTVSDLYAAGDSDNVTGLLFGVSHKWDESDWLLVADYSARFYHPDDDTIERYQLRLGGGYRWLLAENLDLFTHVKAGACAFVLKVITVKMTLSTAQMWVCAMPLPQRLK